MHHSTLSRSTNKKGHDFECKGMSRRRRRKISCGHENQRINGNDSKDNIFLLYFGGRAKKVIVFVFYILF